MKDMHVIVWEFVPREGMEREFENVYGSHGEWAKLLGRSARFLGTELLRGADRTYFTIDRWETSEAFAAFQRQWRREYDELDQRSEALTEEERLIGRFERV